MIYKAERVEPAHDMVLVRRIDVNVTPTGLVLPTVREQESKLARIVEVGPGIPGMERTVPGCKVGEYWIMARFIGEKIDVDGVEYNLVKWGDCLAKIHFSEGALKLLDESLGKAA